MNVLTVIQNRPCEGQKADYCTRTDATSVNLEFGRSGSCFVGTELAGTGCVARYWSDEVLADRLHGLIRQGNASEDPRPAYQAKITATTSPSAQCDLAVVYLLREEINEAPNPIA